MFHKYNLIGCWLATLLMMTLKSFGGSSFGPSWLEVFYPVLIVNGWLILTGIWVRISTRGE